MNYGLILGVMSFFGLGQVDAPEVNEIDPDDVYAEHFVDGVCDDPSWYFEHIEPYYDELHGYYNDKSSFRLRFKSFFRRLGKSIKRSLIEAAEA